MKGTPLKSSTTLILPPAPNLFTALRVGFDSIANHVAIILFPVLLDLLLWMGPQLRITRLVQTFIEQLVAVYNLRDEQLAEVMQAGEEVWLQVAEHFNLLSLLRTFPVGVSSQFASQLSENNPLGQPVSFEITSLWGVVLSWVLLSLLGLAVGSLYFGAVSQVALQGKIIWRDLFQDWPRSTVQVILLAVFWGVLGFVLLLPASFFLSLTFLGMPIAQCIFFIYACLVFWMIIPLFFSPFGIFVLRQSMRNSLRTSVNVSRRTMAITMPFILIIVVISWVTNFLWVTPKETSWWMLVGVLGHAFVTTALLAASFVYFRDAERWSSRVYPAGGLSGKT